MSSLTHPNPNHCPLSTIPSPPSGRYRIYRSKKRIKEILKDRWKIENASLCIQRNWYQWKMQFHTFFLMSSYRAREICDGIEKQDRNRLRNILSLGRVKSLFRKQLIIVRNSAASTIQRFYRGFRARKGVKYIRDRRNAARRIRIWLKLAMRRRHAFARTIQRYPPLLSTHPSHPSLLPIHPPTHMIVTHA